MGTMPAVLIAAGILQKVFPKTISSSDDDYFPGRWNLRVRLEMAVVSPDHTTESSPRGITDTIT